MSKELPFDSECRNQGWGVGWTTPCCYQSLGEVGEGVHDCPECGRKVRCVREDEPVQIATLVDDEEA